MNQELIAYIKEQISLGVSRSELARALISKGGWSEEDVSTAFQHIDSKLGRRVSQKKEGSVARIEKKTSAKALSFVAATLLFAVIFYFVSSQLF